MPFPRYANARSPGFFLFSTALGRFHMVQLPRKPAEARSAVPLQPRLTAASDVAGPRTASPLPFHRVPHLIGPRQRHRIATVNRPETNNPGECLDQNMERASSMDSCSDNLNLCLGSASPPRLMI